MNVFVKYNVRFLLPILGLLLAITAIGAEPTRPKSGNADLPVVIEADRMESEQGKEAVVVFSGRVEARQGDLIVHADRMRVFYAKEDGPEKTTVDKKSPDQTVTAQKIQKFIATGHVEIVQKNWVGTSDSMEYLEDERKVVLTGNARVVQDNNMVAGETIVHYLDEGKSVAQRGSGEGQRVKAIFYPDARKADKSQVNPKPAP